MIRLIPALTPHARELLSRIEGLTLEQIEREISAGPHVQIWEFEDSRGIAGYAVTRLERFGDQHEWVWLACGGRNFLRNAQILKAVADRSGIGIRAYVVRPGMRRLYERLGFRATTTVMESR